jgi:anti-sigma factor RsiW
VTSKHLGDKIHDLLDGRLTGDKAYAAMAHLGECEDCAARFHELRAARDALNTAEAGIDMSFAQRLLDRDRIAQIAAQEPSNRARASAPPDHRPLAAVILVGAAASLVVGMAWMMGAPTKVGLEFVTTASGNSAQPVVYMGAQGMRSGDQLRSWIHPDFAESGLVPVEAKVLQRSNGSNVLVATMLRDMDVVVVTQEHAQLASEVNTLPRAGVEGIDVYVLSSAEPAQVVWQTGDVVIALGCECALSTLESVAAEFPTATDPGFVDRVGEGFEELADLLP